MDKPEPLYMRCRDLEKLAQEDIKTVNICLYYGVINPDGLINGKKLVPLFLEKRKEELIEAIQSRKYMGGKNGFRKVIKRPEGYDKVPVFLLPSHLVEQCEISSEWLMRNMYRGTLVPDAYVEFGLSRVQPLFLESRKEEIIALAAQPVWLETV